MKKAIRNLYFKWFTFIEVVIAFAIITITISINLGYRDMLKEGTAFYDTIEVIYVLNGFTILAILVTSLGITGIQLIQIHRKLYSIGLRKAFGANDTDITMLILKETFYLIYVPAVIGILAGVLLLTIIPVEELYLKANINGNLIIYSVMVLLLFTVISGFLPAMKANKVNPVEVLRNNHLKAERAKSQFKYNIILSIATLSVMLGGILYNHSVEAAYKEDVMNTSGAVPATTEMVPYFSFEDGKGNIITSDSMLGKSYCLIIWETNCTVSINTLKLFNKFINDGTLKGNDVYAVNIDQSFKDADNYVTNNNISIKPFVDSDKSTKWAFNANLIPLVYFVDENGIITARTIGWTDSIEQYLTMIISEY